ncbi:MAG: LCP family protein [Ruminococcus sp.]|jgi:anionic cell wall polymer biosynthesis LytR-Cps2A-Psr (LCP) family protein|nr:LCP family protein [Ruminococcus sp.]
MKKRRRRNSGGGGVIIPFLVTVLFSLIIIGGGMLYLLKEIQKETPEEPKTDVADTYIPGVESNMNILFIIDAGNAADKKDSFVLMRSVPSENKVTFVPLYSDTAVKSGENISTLNNVFDTDGTVKVNTKQAVENLFSIKIDKYIRCTVSSFESLYNMVGKVIYVIPPELEGDYGVGEMLLPANQAATIISKNNYQGGETERVKHLGKIFEKIIDDANGLKLDSVYEDYYTRFLDTAETDFSIVDYKRYESAVRYMLLSDAMHSEVLTPSGNYNSENQFVMNAVFTKGITKSFTNKMPETITSSAPGVTSAQKAGNVAD